MVLLRIGLSLFSIKTKYKEIFNNREFKPKQSSEISIPLIHCFKEIILILI